MRSGDRPGLQISVPGLTSSRINRLGWHGAPDLDPIWPWYQANEYRNEYLERGK
jgi:hypothetical protein